MLTTSSHHLQPKNPSPQPDKGRHAHVKPFTLFLAATVLSTLSTARAQDNSSSAAPNDAQIAMIAVVADNVDIAAGKFAAEKSENQAVKEFAQTMVRDHGAVNAKATALVKKLGVTPEASATSKSLQAAGEAQMEKVKALQGAAFDKAYVDNEVSYHEAVAGVLDKTLLPNTKNPQLKALLESARPIFVSHLEHAKMIQKALSK